MSGLVPKEFFEKYGTSGSDLVEETLMFVEHPDSKKGYTVLVARYFSYGQKSKGMTYHRIPKEWSGRIDIFTYTEQHLRSFEVEEGRLTSYYIYQTEDPSKRIQTHNALMTCTGNWVEFPYINGIDNGIELVSNSIYVVSCHNPDPFGGGTGTGTWPSAPVVSPDYLGGGYTGGGGDGTSPSGGGSTGTTYCDNTNHFGSDCIPFPEEDFEIIKDSSFINTTADCIYEKLKSIDGFKELAAGFEGLGTEFDVKLKIGATQDPNANAQAWYRGSNQPIEITFNEANMNRSTLEVARTIVHEMIHAEMYRAINTSNPTAKELDFRETFEAYTIQYVGDNDSHHNYMADFWVDRMADMLEQIHSQLGYSSLNDFLKTFAYPTGIPKGFYRGLAWEGLKYEDVKGWINKSKEQQDEINFHIDNAKYGTKNCN